MTKNKEELEQKILELEEELEDILEEREFVLAKTSIHVPGVTVAKFEQEINAIKEKIAALKKQLES
ncbi:hypothetical protein [Desulfolucanica intricata]|uniref:hypothetical protein n=1 Tax=Desulfolucanica intricata TaxID=1285191 RepID=UPI000833B5D9|nr:hypothetical protein [Desulfolucanica intricata]